MPATPDSAADPSHASGAEAVLPRVDRRAFANDVRSLRRQLVNDLGPADLAHLRRMERWGRLCTLLGYASAWLLINPLSAALIALGNSARWTMVTHHVMHRGYDRVPGVPARLSSARFARGWRRFLDWPDWIDPRAWALEHNQLHHLHTGELADPDLVERNSRLFRNQRLPKPIRWLALGFGMLSWKLVYYAPSTYWAWRQQQRATARSTVGRREVAGSIAQTRRLIFPGEHLLLPLSADGIGFWCRCILPYAAWRFGLLPALFLPLGTAAWLAVLINSLLAELLSNLHTFMIIAPNHAGDDVYRFEDHYRDADEYLLRQVIGSVNYPGGSDPKDFLQGYLNYQIEHHVWPDLPMLKLRQGAPALKAICARHGVPYLEEPLLVRFGKLWRIMTGENSMRRAGTTPPPLLPVASECEAEAGRMAAQAQTP